tara:strand:- start:5857 stop:6030 length:174 start_codon:yes stop_codon:yes gene_type:complete
MPRKQMKIFSSVHLAKSVGSFILSTVGFIMKIATRIMTTFLAMEREKLLVLNVKVKR